MIESILQSTGLVFASEMGDKTQLLTLALLVKYKKPWPILLGILIATLLNHGMASALGGFVSSYFSYEQIKVYLAVIFFGFAIWMLIPDKLNEDSLNTKSSSVFLTTAFLFFVAEMGDKTQLATIALAAKFQNVLSVTIGTTLGMILADGLVLVLGERIVKKIPFSTLRVVAAGLFALFGVVILFT
jgi:putative Ca2+/H+ antiporter (TMEM165/GDT1 family)